MYGGIPSYQRLAASQVATANVTLATLVNFQFTLPATKKVLIEAVLPCTIGATGGFKFLLNASQTLATYTAEWEMIDGVTADPGAQIALVLTASGNFANAFASRAGNHVCKLTGSLKGHATLDAVVTVQFACNSAAGAITIIEGAYLSIVFVE